MRFALIFIKWNFWATKLLGGDLGLTADKCLVNNGRAVRSLSSVSPEEALGKEDHAGIIQFRATRASEGDDHLNCSPAMCHPL